MKSLIAAIALSTVALNVAATSNDELQSIGMTYDPVCEYYEQNYGLSEAVATDQLAAVETKDSTLAMGLDWPYGFEDSTTTAASVDDVTEEMAFPYAW